MHQPERFHALDSLRAFAMFLGIALHAVLAYTLMRVPFWPVHDAERSFAADLFVYTVHEFRMQVFFLMAGFFACLLYQRYRLRGLFLHRFKRIAIPLAVALLTVQPLLQAIWLIGDPTTLPIVGMRPPEPGEPLGPFVLNHFASGEFASHIRPFHLWFLYYLCLLFAVMLPLLWLGRALADTTAGRRFEAGFRRLAVLPGKSLLLAVPLVPLLWGSRFWSVDTPESWPIHWNVLTYYLIFFGFGWLLYRHRDLLGAFAGRWRSALLAGNLLVLPVMLYCVGEGLKLRDQGIATGERFLAFKVGGIYLGCVYTWLMVGGLTGAFQHWFGRERRWVRYLADSAYWCYIMHLIPLVLLQMAVEDVALPGLVKFLIVVVGSMAVLLLSYEYLVRYTFIGTALNGPRKRPKRTVVDARAAPELAPAQPTP